MRVCTCTYAYAYARACMCACACACTCKLYMCMHMQVLTTLREELGEAGLSRIASIDPTPLSTASIAQVCMHMRMPHATCASMYPVPHAPLHGIDGSGPRGDARRWSTCRPQAAARRGSSEDDARHCRGLRRPLTCTLTDLTRPELNLALPQVRQKMMQDLQQAETLAELLQ